MPAIPAIAMAVSAIVQAKMASNAANKASEQQQAAQGSIIENSRQAAAVGQEKVNTAAGQSDQILKDSEGRQLDIYRPYIAAGQSGLEDWQKLTSEGGPLSNQFSFGQKDLDNDPGYQFTLSEGNKAIQRSAAAQGGLFSGATLKSLSDFNRRASSTYFNDAYNRARGTFETNRQGALARVASLQDLARLGYGGAAASAGAIQNTAVGRANTGLNAAEFNARLGVDAENSVNRAMDARGDAQAAGTVGSANATNQGIAGVSNALQNYLVQRAQANQTSGSVGGYIPSSGGYQLPSSSYSGSVPPPPSVSSYPR